MPDTPVLRAAIYARKSTEQRGADDEAKSVALQIRSARAFAARFQYVPQTYQKVRPPLVARETACIDPPHRAHRPKPFRKYHCRMPRPATRDGAPIAPIACCGTDHAPLATAPRPQCADGRPES
jgi:hypothetical protein